MLSYRFTSTAIKGLQIQPQTSDKNLNRAQTPRGPNKIRPAPKRQIAAPNMSH